MRASAFHTVRGTPVRPPPVKRETALLLRAGEPFIRDHIVYQKATDRDGSKLSVPPWNKKQGGDPPKNRGGDPPSDPKSFDTSGSPRLIREENPRTSEHNRRSDKPIWLAIALVAATVGALAVGVIFRAAGANAMDAMTAAGGAFVAILTLFFGAWAFLH